MGKRHGQVLTTTIDQRRCRLRSPLMPLPRKRVLDATRAQWVHGTSRCVRRAFLCGGRYEHRKDWVQDRLRELAGLFAAEVAGYAVMANHLHQLAQGTAVRMVDREIPGHGSGGGV